MWMPWVKASNDAQAPRPTAELMQSVGKPHVCSLGSTGAERGFSHVSYSMKQVSSERRSRTMGNSLPPRDPVTIPTGYLFSARVQIGESRPFNSKIWSGQQSNLPSGSHGAAAVYSASSPRRDDEDKRGQPEESEARWKVYDSSPESEGIPSGLQEEYCADAAAVSESRPGRREGCA